MTAMFTIAWLVKKYEGDNWELYISEPDYCHEKQQVVILHNEPLGEQP